jgi:rod shape-determining protein MreD
MPQLRIAAVLALTILLQLSLRKVWGPLVYIDLPLVVVVYVALQREALQALICGTLAGLAVDGASIGILGTGGFSKTFTAYVIFFAATRINLENPLLRIPILAAAAAMDASVYVGLHRLLGQPLEAPFVQTIAYRVIGTTIVGTLVILMLDNLLSTKARQRRQFAERRKVARRTTGLGKRRP